MPAYHYTESGLDNVFIEGVLQGPDHTDEDSITIPAIGLLHKVIAEGIVTHPAKMTGQELRFLRSEMGLTQAQLGQVLKVVLLTVSRWERNAPPIQDGAEMLVRLLAVEALGLDVELGVKAVSEKVTEAAQVQQIRIDGSERGRYRLLNAA